MKGLQSLRGQWNTWKNAQYGLNIDRQTVPPLGQLAVLGMGAAAFGGVAFQTGIADSILNAICKYLP